MESKLEIYQIVFFMYIITGAIHITYIVTFLYIICESFSYQTNRSVSTAQLGETKKKHPADFIGNAEQGQRQSAD